MDFDVRMAFKDISSANRCADLIQTWWADDYINIAIQQPTETDFRYYVVCNYKPKGNQSKMNNEEHDDTHAILTAEGEGMISHEHHPNFNEDSKPVKTRSRNRRKRHYAVKTGDGKAELLYLDARTEEWEKAQTKFSWISKQFRTKVAAEAYIRLNNATAAALAYNE